MKRLLHVVNQLLHTLETLPALEAREHLARIVVVHRHGWGFLQGWHRRRRLVSDGRHKRRELLQRVSIVVLARFLRAEIEG